MESVFVNISKTYDIEKDVEILAVWFRKDNSDKYIAMELTNNSLDEFIRVMEPMIARLKMELE